MAYDDDYRESDISDFMGAVSGQESTDDDTAVNSYSGCAGRFQFCQSTWNTWAKAAGRDDLVGVNPAECSTEEQYGVMKAKTEAMYDRYKGNFAAMADEHYAGEGTADAHYEDGDYSTSEESGGYPSQSQYISEVLNRMNNRDTDDEGSIRLNTEPTYEGSGSLNDAFKFADSLISNGTFYGVNGCTAFVKDFLDAEGYGADGLSLSCPEMLSQMSAKNCLTDQDAAGEIIFLQAPNDSVAGHVVISDGQGGYYGNSSYAHRQVWHGSLSDFTDDGWTILGYGNPAGNTPQASDYYPQGQAHSWGEGFQEPVSPITKDEYLESVKVHRARDVDGEHEEPSLVDAIWHDFKRSGNFAYGFFNALYNDLYHSDHNALAVKPDMDNYLDYVKAAIGGDEDKARYLISTSRDDTELAYAIENCKQEMAEDRKYHDYYSKYGLHNIGYVLGMLADPINYVPVLKGVTVAKGLVRLGEVAKFIPKADLAVIDAERAAKIASLADNKGFNVGVMGGNMAAMSTVQEYVDAKLKGEDPHLAAAALSGAVAGSVLKCIGLGLGKMRTEPIDSLSPMLGLENAANRVGRATQDEAMGVKSVYTAGDSKNIASEMHDSDFFKNSDSVSAQRMASRDDVYALSYEDAKKVADKIGIPLSESTRGFYVPSEDYSVIIKDNPATMENLEGVIRHEVGVHQDLRKLLTPEEYQQTMDMVSKQSQDVNSPFHEAMKRAGSSDPEEILGYAVENGLINKPQKISKILDNIKSGMHRLGLGEPDYTRKDELGILGEIFKNQREKASGLNEVVNADGTVSLNGVKFSKDNAYNPVNLVKTMEMAKDVDDALRGTTFGDKVLDAIDKPIERTRFTQTPFSVGLYSHSPTFAKVISSFFEDPQMRGTEKLTGVSTTCERMGEFFRRKLDININNMVKCENQWLKDNVNMFAPYSPSSHNTDRQYFRFLVEQCFCDKYVKNPETGENIITSMVSDKSLYDASVQKAADELKKLTDERIEIGKHNGDMYGNSDSNLIESGWYDVDTEPHRKVNDDKLTAFAKNFVNNGDAEMKAYLMKYILGGEIGKDANGNPIKFDGALDKDLFIQMEKRDWELHQKETPEEAMENQRSLKNDAQKKADQEGKPEPKFEVPEDIETRMAAAAEEWVNRIVGQVNLDRSFDSSASVGDLNFFRGRLPMDTGKLMPMPDGNGMFSFDKNLRDFDIIHHYSRTNARFAGEAAMKNTISMLGYGSDLNRLARKIKSELEFAAKDHKLSAADAERYGNYMDDFMNELRGMRPKRELMNEADVVSNALNAAAYFKRGGLMGFSQLGDLASAIGYGGLHMIGSAFKPLANFIDDCRLGKANMEQVRDANWFMFGQPMEHEIWSKPVQDYAAQASIGGSKFNNALVDAGQFFKNMSRYTSQLNMLGSMTDSMFRTARNGAMCDCIRWAHGDSFGGLRNPFSATKLKALGVDVDVEQLQKDIRKYIPWDGRKDTVASKFDTENWAKTSPLTFHQFKDIIQNQTEREVLSSHVRGNRNIFKDTNWMTRLACMFQDFNLRSNGSQFMRALRHHERDDIISAGLSMVMNSAAYAGRNALKIAALYALGQTDQAQYVKDNYLNTAALGRAAFTRSGYMSPLSMANNAYEVGMGVPTVRTTVTDKPRASSVNSAGDFIGNTIQQTPSVDTVDTMIRKPIGAAWALAHDRASKTDIRNLLEAIPVPDMIPMSQMMDAYSNSTKYPQKRPKAPASDKEPLINQLLNKI